MNVYKVNVEYTTFVYADSEKKAEEIALSSEVTDEIYSGNIDFINTEIVTSINEIPRTWQNALPFIYQDSDNKEELTIKELLK